MKVSFGDTIGSIFKMLFYFIFDSLENVLHHVVIRVMDRIQVVQLTKIWKNNVLQLSH